MERISTRNDAAALCIPEATIVAPVEKMRAAEGLARGSVDVVIPMRDGARTILLALESVVAQTVPPGQIFVIDDGSKDGGGALARATQYPSLTVIETLGHGVSHARNVGIARSQADFVAFLDCDDLWAADKLEQQLAVMHKNKQAAVVTCGSMSLDMKHRPLAGTSYLPRLRGDVFEKTLQQGFIRGGLSSNMLVRRSALLAVGGFDESMAFGEDMDLWLRLARHHVFDYCCAPLAHIVENLDSTTRRRSTPTLRREMVLQPLCCLEKWVDDGYSSRWILAFGARLILVHILRERLTAQEIRALQKAIIARAPKLARWLARTRTHLIAAVMLAGLVYLPGAWSTWRLRRRRLQSWKSHDRDAGTASLHTRA